MQEQKPSSILAQGQEASGVRSSVPLFLGIPSEFFYLSSSFSVALMVLFGTQGFRRFIFARTEILNDLTYYADPLLFHLLSILTIVWVILKYRSAKGKNRVHSVLIASLIPAMLMLIDITIVEGFWLRKSLGFPLSDLIMFDSFLTHFVKRLIGLEAILSAPAGSCLRQTTLLLLLIGIVTSYERMGFGLTPRNAGRSLIAANVMGVLVVAFVSMYREASSFFHVAGAVSMSIFSFWLLVSLYNSFLSVAINKTSWREGRELLTFFTGYSALIICIFFFYCHHAEAWVISAIVIFFLIGLCYVLSNWHKATT